MPAITHNQTLSNPCFPETTEPYATFMDEKKPWIAVACSYYAQWSARSIPMRSNTLLFYDKHDLTLTGCIDPVEFYINDVGAHPDSGLIAVATGQYDGGAYFEGKLLLWDSTTGDLRSLFTDNREVKKCAFVDHGRKLQFVVSPIDDLDDQPYTLITYELEYPCPPAIDLGQLTPVSIVQTSQTTFGGYKSNRIRAEKQLAAIAAKAGRHYVPKNMIWDILFLDDHTIATARSHSTVEIWNTLTGELGDVRLPEEGDCVQLFLNPANQTLLVNFWDRNWESRHNTFYSVKLPSLDVEEIIRCNHYLSQNNGNNFLARQTDFLNKNAEDFIIDPGYNIVYINRLGHYDLFNHYIRIDGHDALYFLVGDPSETHENKICCSIDPQKGKIKKLWQVEKKPDHFNETSAVLFKDTLVFSGKRFRPYSEVSELFGIDLAASREIWHAVLPANTSALAVMEAVNGVLVALTSGEILLVDITTGQTLASITPTHNFTFERPLSLAVRGTRFAAGLTNGEIRVYDVEAP